jgi:hypothetical protein
MLYAQIELCIVFDRELFCSPLIAISALSTTLISETFLSVPKTLSPFFKTLFNNKITQTPTSSPKRSYVHLPTSYLMYFLKSLEIAFQRQNKIFTDIHKPLTLISLRAYVHRYELYLFLTFREYLHS